MESHENPYASGLAGSKYYKFENEKLVHIFNGTEAGIRAAHLHHQARAMIESPSFPCFGAKATIRQNVYRFACYDGMEAEETLKAICHDLYAFAREQRQIKSDFTSFIVCFDHTKLKDAHDFEDKVWKLLGGMCSEDVKHNAWDPHASSDPESADFSFSFAGTSYFVAALSPVSPRMSRQFVVPALVFNAHYQFAHMREKGVFNKLRDKIRAGDTLLENGVPNDLAASFGETSGAIQYCGVKPKAEEKWKCPFHKYFKPS